MPLLFIFSPCSYTPVLTIDVLHRFTIWTVFYSVNCYTSDYYFQKGPWCFVPNTSRQEVSPVSALTFIAILCRSFGTLYEVSYLPTTTPCSNWDMMPSHFAAELSCTQAISSLGAVALRRPAQGQKGCPTDSAETSRWECRNCGTPHRCMQTLRVSCCHINSKVDWLVD